MFVISICIRQYYRIWETFIYRLKEADLLGVLTEPPAMIAFGITHSQQPEDYYQYVIMHLQRLSEFFCIK